MITMQTEQVMTGAYYLVDIRLPTSPAHLLCVTQPPLVCKPLQQGPHQMLKALNLVQTTWWFKALQLDKHSSVIATMNEPSQKDHNEMRTPL